MLLPRGVTGIWTLKEASPSCTDYSAFRGRCYSAAREAGWSVREVLVPRSAQACNYALAVLESHEASLSVALNGVFPLLAFATPPEPGQHELNFCDNPLLALAFKDLDYSVLLADQLTAPLDRAMLRNLEEHELNEIRYFRPRRVGDVIFNCWD